MSRSWTTFVKKNSWNSLQNKPAILSDDQISFSEIINKPTTLSGYGITDAQPLGNELTALQTLADTTICWDSNYIYVCTETNTWKRASLSSW